MLDAVIVGAGPSGLAAGYEMTRHGARVAVLERLDRVGGLARTMPHDGCLFDIGPHRFFTKNEEVRQLFVDIVAEDLLRVPRLTRIYYRNKFFNYPLTPLNALFGVGVASSVAIFLSYLNAAARQTISPVEPVNFEQWVTNQFGSRLYETFFKTYTEKVWGIPCTQIGADWAGQRIKGLSLIAAVQNALLNGKGNKIKTLVDEFLFPRLGAGQLYEKLAQRIEDRGNTVAVGRKVLRMNREGLRVRSVEVCDGQGRAEEYEGGYFMSSAPLTEMVEMMNPAPPDAVLAACRSLRYRDHVGVHLKVEGTPFPDNWIYVHDKRFRMARIANFRNFSHAMAEHDGVSPLTVEYFTFKGDDTWRRSDEELIDFALGEIAQMFVGKTTRPISGFVVRSEKAYPVIELGFQKHIDVIKSWLDGFENLKPIGRSGMFKYNNQDHAIATGLLAARTALGLGKYDPWLVNIDAEYHEAGESK
ncbi:MAG: FAD-dependent oxidoreductase [Acidobacteriia bacterium]|nr:FAD-dependent oxidoreductase [Terriglobia bacterium]